MFIFSSRTDQYWVIKFPDVSSVVVVEVDGNLIIIFMDRIISSYVPELIYVEILSNISKRRSSIMLSFLSSFRMWRVLEVSHNDFNLRNEFMVYP